MKERNVWLIFDVWLRSYSVFQGWSLLISFSLKWKKKVLFTHSPYTVNPPHQLYQFISMTSAQKNSHTQKHSCAVTHTTTRVLSHTSLDKTLFIWLFHFKTIWFMTLMTNCFSALHMTECLHSIYEWLCGCACILWRNDHSYLSMIAHMSKLTFSKAPMVPFSTACKSAGWSSTKIACMQPWKERWEGGKSVWRK